MKWNRLQNQYMYDIKSDVEVQKPDDGFFLCKWYSEDHRHIV